MYKLLLISKVALAVAAISLFPLLTSCATSDPDRYMNEDSPTRRPTQNFAADYTSRLPQYMDTGGTKMVLVDPNVHAWGAYNKDGQLIRAGIATSGGVTCPSDSNEPSCKTNSGIHRITSLGNEDCYSKRYPRPTGGGLMPFCMYFSDGQALHGSPDDIVGEYNVSHGCVRMRIPDAEWMRYNFAQVGTKVMVVPYNRSPDNSSVQ